MSVSTWPRNGRPPVGWGPTTWPVIVIVVVTVCVLTVGLASVAAPDIVAGMQASTGIAALVVALLGLRQRRARTA